jgi:hypothetical protein
MYCGWFHTLAISGKFAEFFFSLLQVVLDHVARAESLYREDHPSQRVHGSAKDSAGGQATGTPWVFSQEWHRLGLGMDPQSWEQFLLD